MKRNVLLLIVLIFFGASSFVAAQSSKSNVDLEKVASNLVNQCANIHEGDIVLVSGGIKNLELLENIAVNVRKKGAFPLLTVDSDRMTRRMFTEVPVKYDSQVPELSLQIVKLMDAQISVASMETPGLLADIPPERFAARNEASKPIQDYMVKNPVKNVSIGNGIYPTQASADEFGISLNKLSELFWSGINVDYNALAVTVKKLSAALKDGNDLLITNNNGTQLSVKVANCPIFNSDGIIDEEDMKKGMAGYAVYLPAGEVYLVPVKGTANGKVVVENFTFQGKKIEGLSLQFKDGKMTSITAASGLEPLKKYIDSMGEGLDEFSVIDFGINPNIKIPDGSSFVCWMSAGMITVVIGNNTWAGGDNNASGGINFFLPGCTATLDGKTLVDKGNLKF